MSDASVGFIAAGVAVLCFGSNFVPVKKFETGDGVFFQCAIWICGMVVNAIQGFPRFEPLAMLGGALWCTGNLMVVPIVKMIGLGMGMLLWGTANLVVGWSSGTFGMFHLRKEEVPKPALNYVGVIFALVSIVIYVFVKTDVESTVKRSSINDDDEQHVGLINNTPSANGKLEQTTSWVDRLNDKQKKLLGVFLSVVSGFFYGVNFDPPQYLMDHGHSQNGLDYVFSHFCGIYLTSTFFFLLYSALKKNKPAIFPEAILPAFLSGALWAIAQICWFIANTKLALVVAFPIISTGPGVIASLWGVLVFKEIKGKRNLLVLAAAFTLTIVSVILITLSKIG